MASEISFAPGDLAAFAETVDRLLDRLSTQRTRLTGYANGTMKLRVGTLPSAVSFDEQHRSVASGTVEAIRSLERHLRVMRDAANEVGGVYASAEEVNRALTHALDRIMEAEGASA